MIQLLTRSILQNLHQLRSLGISIWNTKTTYLELVMDFLHLLEFFLLKRDFEQRSWQLRLHYSELREKFSEKSSPATSSLICVSTSTSKCYWTCRASINNCFSLRSLFIPTYLLLQLLDLHHQLHHDLHLQLHCI